MSKSADACFSTGSVVILEFSRLFTDFKEPDFTLAACVADAKWDPCPGAECL